MKLVLRRPLRLGGSQDGAAGNANEMQEERAPGTNLNEPPGGGVEERKNNTTRKKFYPSSVRRLGSPG